MTRPEPHDVQRVACIGAGTVGAGWAAVFLSRGMDVTVADPDPKAEDKARDIVDQAWPFLEDLGLGEGADRGRMSVVPSVAAAVADAQFVQESAPEDEALKIALMAEIAEAAPAATVIASSSSQFLPSRLASGCRAGERVIVGHPFVPSYLIPLVEVVGGETTDSAVLDWAVAFYRAIGKHPLRLQREIEAYIANRLQFVIFKEAEELVAQGICDFADVDTAMTRSIGLRWAFAGPLLCQHLGGGKGGLGHFIDHFGWRGREETRIKALESADRLAGHLTIDELESWRDRNLAALLKSLEPLP